MNQHTSVSRIVAATVLLAAGVVSANILENAPSGFSAYAVDPCGATPLRPDDAGASARLGGLDAVAAAGSVATLSFAIVSETPVKVFSATCDGLAREGGKIPAGAVDMLLVKRWYQDGNAWFTVVRDPAARALVPELLLHDDGLVSVDAASRANLVRVGGSPVSSDTAAASDPDAPALCPFPLPASEARQIILRIAIASGTAPGIYRGPVVFTADGKPAGSATVTLRVLAYDLPRPSARFTGEPYHFLSIGKWPAPPEGTPSPFTAIDAGALEKDGYEVGDKEDLDLASTRKYHVFRAAATRRQLQARHAIGAVALEAMPLAGVENPAPWRREKGLSAWLAGYGGVLIPQLAEAESPWRDDHGETRSRTILYPPAGGGAIPTLASVALEEAWHDVCYLSEVNHRARALLASKDSKTVTEGRRALAWLADVAAAQNAPDTVRLDAIAWIERLRMLSEGGNAR